MANATNGRLTWIRTALAVGSVFAALAAYVVTTAHQVDTNCEVIRQQSVQIERLANDNSTQREAMARVEERVITIQRDVTELLHRE